MLGRDDDLQHWRGRTRTAVDHALNVDAHVGVLEARDALAAAVAVRKERERITGDLLEDGVVVATREGHERESTEVWTERNALPIRQIRPGTGTPTTEYHSGQ